MKWLRAHRERAWLGILMGALLVAAYYWLVHPVGFARGYMEDFCADLARIVLSENLGKSPSDFFKTERVMAPFGSPVPFFSWSIEREGLGAILWKWAPEFPFLPVYVALSLLLSFIGVGWMLGKIGFSPLVRWLVAGVLLTYNMPRHFKFWHHHEYLVQHFIYLSLTLDAWIWSRWVRRGEWSLTSEIWRGFLLVAVLSGPGYFWGPLFVSWAVVRIFMLRDWLGGRVQPKWLLNWKQAAPAMVLGLGYLAIEVPWFLSLTTEMKRLGDIPQGMGWFAHLGYVARPIWLEAVGWLFTVVTGSAWPLQPFYVTETAVTVGWVLWIPALLALRVGARRLVTPFLVLSLIGILYACFPKPEVFHTWIQALVPPMKFFRVATRWGIYLHHYLALSIVLAWPELSAWAKSRWGESKGFRAALGVFAVLSLVEVGWLLYPVSMPEPLHPTSVQLLNEVAKLPGDTVLDLPFCVAGGNGVCTGQQCPQYPSSTVGQCLTAWHSKKVYGLYQARLVFSQCETYNRRPYTGWFAAWQSNRCLSDFEFEEFCQYLEAQPRMSAVLVYPDIWTALNEPVCEANLKARLGPPERASIFNSVVDRRGGPPRYMRIWQFPGKCQRKVSLLDGLTGDPKANERTHPLEQSSRVGDV